MNENPKPHCEMCQSPAPAEAVEPEGPSEAEIQAEKKKEEEAAKENARIEKAKTQEE